VHTENNRKKKKPKTLQQKLFLNASNPLVTLKITTNMTAVKAPELAATKRTKSSSGKYEDEEDVPLIIVIIIEDESDTLIER